MDVQFQEPFTRTAHKEVKQSEARKKPTEQPTPKQNYTFVVAPSPHTMPPEPKQKASHGSVSMSVEGAFSQANDNEHARDIIIQVRDVVIII